MTPTFEHLESHEMPTTAKAFICLPIAPPMQTIIVNCELVVNPKLATVIRDNAKAVIASLEDSQAAGPAHSEVVTSGKTRPAATCVTVVDIMFPAGHVRFAIIQPLASATLTKVEDVFPEESMTISGLSGHVAATTCKHNCPSVGSIITSITKLHPSMPTTLKHLKSCEMPSTTEVFGCLPVTPAMQAVVIDRVAIVQPQLASIIGDDAKTVMSRLENSEFG
jgi:hypothetical protein